MNDRTLEMTMLFDFFSELLTEKQREYFDLYYNEDLSLSEIAEIAGISRQGVRDIITRAEKILCDTEEKTGIVGRFVERNRHIKELESCALQIRDNSEGSVREISDKMLGILDKMKG